MTSENMSGYDSVTFADSELNFGVVIAESHFQHSVKENTVVAHVQYLHFEGVSAMVYT